MADLFLELIDLNDTYDEMVAKINRTFKILEERQGPTGAKGNPGFVGLPGISGNKGEQGERGFSDKILFVSSISITNGIETLTENNYYSFLRDVSVITENEYNSLINNTETQDTLDKIETFENSIDQINIYKLIKNTSRIYKLTNITNNTNYDLSWSDEGVLIQASSFTGGSSIFVSNITLNSNGNPILIDGTPSESVENYTTKEVEDNIVLNNIYLDTNNFKIKIQNINDTFDTPVQNNFQARQMLLEEVNPRLLNSTMFGVIDDFKHKLSLINTASLSTEINPLNSYSPLLLLGNVDMNNNEIDYNTDLSFSDENVERLFSGFFSVGIHNKHTTPDVFNTDEFEHNLVFIPRQLTTADRPHKYTIGLYSDEIRIGSTGFLNESIDDYVTLYRNISNELFSKNTINIDSGKKIRSQEFEIKPALGSTTYYLNEDLSSLKNLKLFDGNKNSIGLLSNDISISYSYKNATNDNRNITHVYNGLSNVINTRYIEKTDSGVITNNVLLESLSYVSGNSVRNQYFKNIFTVSAPVNDYVVRINNTNSSNGSGLLVNSSSSNVASFIGNGGGVLTLNGSDILMYKDTTLNQTLSLTKSSGVALNISDNLLLYSTYANIKDYPLYFYNGSDITHKLLSNSTYLNNKVGINTSDNINGENNYALHVQDDNGGVVVSPSYEIENTEWDNSISYYELNGWNFNTGDSEIESIDTNSGEFNLVLDGNGSGYYFQYTFDESSDITVDISFILNGISGGYALDISRSDGGTEQFLYTGLEETYTRSYTITGSAVKYIRFTFTSSYPVIFTLSDFIIRNFNNFPSNYALAVDGDSYFGNGIETNSINSNGEFSSLTLYGDATIRSQFGTTTQVDLYFNDTNNYLRKEGGVVSSMRLVSSGSIILEPTVSETTYNGKIFSYGALTVRSNAEDTSDGNGYCMNVEYRGGDISNGPKIGLKDNTLNLKGYIGFSGNSLFLTNEDAQSYVGLISNGDVVLSPGASGNAKVDGSIISTSDVRLKENIKVIDMPYEILDRLLPKEFNFIDKEKKCFGFIAQDIEKIEEISNLVINSDDYKGLDYIGFIAILTDIIKKQKVEIEKIKNKINII